MLYEPDEASQRALPYINAKYGHLTTTLNIDDSVMAELKREAARQGRTMSELVETALRLLRRRRFKSKRLADMRILRDALPACGIPVSPGNRHRWGRNYHIC